MTTFKKVEKKRLPELVASQIENSIVEGVFGFGSQLPSEPQLAEEFGVSRNVVREAFKYLQARGLIEIYNGSGAYVCEPSGKATSSALGRYIRLLGTHTSIEALYEARRSLEGTNARLAAQRANAQNLETLAHCLQRMKDHAGLIERWTRADLDFHLEVARATHNPFMSLLLEPLVDQLHGVIAEGYIVPGAVERGLEAHTRLYQYIASKDAHNAYLTMIEHLYDSEKRIMEIDPRGPKASAAPPDKS